MVPRQNSIELVEIEKSEYGERQPANTTSSDSDYTRRTREQKYSNNKGGTELRRRGSQTHSAGLSKIAESNTNISDIQSASIIEQSEAAQDAAGKEEQTDFNQESFVKQIFGADEFFVGYLWIMNIMVYMLMLVTNIIYICFLCKITFWNKSGISFVRSNENLFFLVHTIISPVILIIGLNFLTTFVSREVLRNATDLSILFVITFFIGVIFILFGFGFIQEMLKHYNYIYEIY